VEEFPETLAASLVRWEKVLARRSSRKWGRIDLYEAASGFYQMREGFRRNWYRSNPCAPARPQASTAQQCLRG
jgi:hypothetical protein